MNPCPCCCHPGSPIVTRRRSGLFATVFKLVLLYVGLVWGGGALIGSGNPLAAEVGKLVHVVTFVDPAIAWTDAQGWGCVANGMRVLASGAPFNHAA